jgi:hypothetical protein
MRTRLVFALFLGALAGASCGDGGGGGGTDAATPGPDGGGDAAPTADAPPTIDARPPADAAPPDATTAMLPDLILDEAAITPSIRQETEFFAADACELSVEEQCVLAAGNRKLLKFETTTANVGTSDMVAGTPSASNPLFLFSPCHGHYHFRDYANYELVDQSGAVVAAGHKQAFCLMDLDVYDPAIANPGPNYSCSYQGLTRGWKDIYSASLPCQLIDITDVPPGDYRLRIEVNPEHIIPELDYSNNRYERAVTID